jgi:hypothetical protein
MHMYGHRSPGDLPASRPLPGPDYDKEILILQCTKTLRAVLVNIAKIIKKRYISYKRSSNHYIAQKRYALYWSISLKSLRNATLAINALPITILYKTLLHQKNYYSRQFYKNATLSFSSLLRQNC